MIKRVPLPPDPRLAPIVDLRRLLPLIVDKPDEEALAEARLLDKLGKRK